MKIYRNVVIIFAVMVGVFICVALSRADETPTKNAGAEPVSAKEICGVQCRLRPNKDKWPANSIPKLKAYIPSSGNKNLWLVTIVQQGCRIQVDGQWYRYVGPEWMSDIIGRTLSDWIAREGGFLDVSLNKEHWMTLSDSKLLALVPGEHTISVGWAGYKADPTGNSDHEDNPILLVSEPVRIRILEAGVAAPVVSPGDERHRQVMEMFDIYVQKDQLTEAELKLGIRTDLRRFHNWWPKFKWEDIPVLLELARNEELVNDMPKLGSSSYIGGPCRKGMIALWFIEGLRREKLSLASEKQLGEKIHPASFRLPLNPICVKEGMGMSECEKSVAIHRAILQGYRQWWNKVESLPAEQAAAFYPLDHTDIRWYGTPEHR